MLISLCHARPVTGCENSQRSKLCKPSIHLLSIPTYPMQGRKGLESIPARIEQEAVYHMTETYRQTTIHTHTSCTANPYYMLILCRLSLCCVFTLDIRHYQYSESYIPEHWYSPLSLYMLDLSWKPVDVQAKQKSIITILNCECLLYSFQCYILVGNCEVQWARSLGKGVNAVWKTTINNG